MFRKMIMTIGLALVLALPAQAEVFDKHVQELLVRANDGDIAAEWQLKAAPYMEQIAGSILADFNLYGHNIGSNENMTIFYTGTHEDMVKSWQEASRGLKGFPNMTLLTDIYTHGLSVNKDVGVAVKMHEKLARAGDLSSQKFLYRYYGPWTANYDAEPDDAAALEWYQMAASQNDVAALYELGQMHLNGRGVVVDYVKAYVYTARAYAATDYMWPMRNKYRAVLEQDITPAMTEAQLREARKLLEQAGLEPERYL